MRNTAFITGGSGGIGSEICREFAKAGYPIAIGYNKNKESAKRLAEQINSAGGYAMITHCDIRSCESIDKSMAEVKENLGTIETLINNAGCADINLFTDLSDSDINELIDTNLIGAMRCSRRVLPEMIRRKHGVIINITSVWGEIGASCEVTYSAAKAGLIGFTKALAKEVAPSGIRVNAVSAGIIDTPMNSTLSPDDIKMITDEIPLCRIGKPTDIAKCALFLASKDASYLCGQILRADGGWCG